VGPGGHGLSHYPREFGGSGLPPGRPPPAGSGGAIPVGAFPVPGDPGDSGLNQGG